MTQADDPYPPPGAAVPGAPPPLHRQTAEVQDVEPARATGTGPPPVPVTARTGRRYAVVAGAVVVALAAVGYLVLSRHRRRT